MSLFGLEEATKVFLYARPADMRKGFDGLYGLVLEEMSLDPRLGYLFCFYEFATYSHQSVALESGWLGHFSQALRTWYI
jgi:hypothetical protein